MIQFHMPLENPTPRQIGACLNYDFISASLHLIVYGYIYFNFQNTDYFLYRMTFIDVSRRAVDLLLFTSPSDNISTLH